MKKFFLILIFLLNLINQAIYTAEQKAGKEHPRHEQELGSFVLRFQTTGNPKSDNELKKMIDVGKYTEAREHAVATLRIEPKNAAYRALPSLKDKFEVNTDYTFPILFNIEYDDNLVKIEGIEFFYLNFKTGFSPGYSNILPIKRGKKYIIRLHCTDEQLKKQNFKKLDLNAPSWFEPRKPGELTHFSLCIEEQDI